jgi:hypothetical protein
MQDEHERSKREHFDGFLRKPVLRYKLFYELSKFLPHSIIENKIEEEETIVLSDLAKVNLPTILNILHSEIEPLHAKAIKSNNIADVKKMADAVDTLAEKYDVSVLAQYASNLYEAIDQFDIGSIEVLLKKMLEIEKNLSDNE